MSIHRSGLKNPVYVVCLSSLKVDGILLVLGEKYELVHDIGSMYVIKTSDGREIIAPKDIFKDA